MTSQKLDREAIKARDNPGNLHWRIRPYKSRRKNGPSIRFAVDLWYHGIEWTQILGGYGTEECAREAAEHGWGPETLAESKIYSKKLRDEKRSRAALLSALKAAEDERDRLNEKVEILEAEIRVMKKLPAALAARGG